MRRAMAEMGVRKAPGFSSLEAGGAVHEFLSGELAAPPVVAASVLSRMAESGMKFATFS